MAENSKIEWTHHTFNSWFGCTEVSPACDHCYARVLMQDRFKKAEWGKGKERVLASDAMWEKPFVWNRRAEKNGVRERVFCASLADVFDTKRGKAILRKQFDALAPQAEMYLKQHKEADDATLFTDPQDASIASDA